MKPSLAGAAGGVCAAALLAGAPATALAGSGASHGPSPKGPASAPAQPPAPAGAPAPGSLRLVVLDARGNPPFQIAGQRMVVVGTVTPYVSGQTVKFSVYRDGRKVAVKTVPVVALGNGSGRVHIVYSSASAGLVQVRAAHYASGAQAQFTARTRSIRFASTDLSEGAVGGSVWLLQAELASLHYDVPRNGIYEGATGRAVIAYRKVIGLERVPSANTRIFQLLQQGAGGFHVRYRSDGRHVEGDLSKQVLAEIEPGGRVHAIYDMSSGKPSTPTVVGRFRVYEKTPGYNSEGMLDSNYFIAGYAIHGYAEVPTFAASHGCLRVPIPDAAAIFAWVQQGTPVDVYDDYGGGSTHVRSNAGP
jgi:peptidoglycan hydrolase-like protein with peptidoglycan-binding domain